MIRSVLISCFLVTLTAGSTLLPGAHDRMSRILGGIQFSHTFSPANTLQSEGCPSFPMTTCGTTENPFTPAEGLYEVLDLSYFPGTVAGPIFAAPTNVSFGNWVYKNAPMNFLEIYDTDIIYASGLSNCSVLEITGSPLNKIQPDVNACVIMAPLGGFGSVLKSQVELDLASLGIWLTEEGPTVP